jgi:hypothetical protein
MARCCWAAPFGALGVVSDGKQLFSLLVFEVTHLVLDHFALEETLSARAQSP